MIKKLISSLVGCAMLCCTVSAPLVAGSADDSPENYMIFDPEDYGEQIYSYSNDTSLYRSSSDERIPLDEIPINESIIGLDESVIKVMIDPGHNAYENQSPVYSPYWESVMTWKLSNYLQEELQALGVHADLTKSTLEEKPALQPRGHKSKGYDFFISIHSNAASYSSMDKPIALCYQNLSWTTIDDTSREIGALLASKVAEVMETNQKGEIFQRLSAEDRDGNGVWDDEWYGVLCGARYVGTPGILLEHSFHTNYRATIWLYNDDNLKRLAKEEAAVIFQYFTEKKAKDLATATTTETTKSTEEITTTEITNYDNTTSPVESITTETVTTTVRIDPVPVENGKIGDVDGDGSVSINDATLALEYYARSIAGLEARFIWLEDNLHGEELIFKIADINSNGQIDISDATSILRLYAEMIAGNIKE